MTTTVYPQVEGRVLTTDTSEAQGFLSEAQWREFKEKAGVIATCNRSSVGVFGVDKCFYKNTLNARRAGLFAHAYQLFYTIHDPVLQARIFFKTARSNSDLRPAMDFEKFFTSVSIFDSVEKAYVFLQESGNLWGVVPLFYSYVGFVNQCYAANPKTMQKIAEMTALWSASYVGHYKDGMQPMKTVVPGWAPEGWQFDGDNYLRMPGTGPDVDFDFFMGTRKEMLVKWGLPNTPRKIVTVEDAQFALLQMGYDLPKYGADGKAGAETRAAILAFEKDRVLPSRGELNETLKVRLYDSLVSVGEWAQGQEDEAAGVPSTRRTCQ